MRRILTLCLVAFGFVTAGQLPAPARADTQLVVLKSGEEIYGTVSPGADKQLVVQTLTGKTRRIPWSQVDSVKTLGAAATPPAVVSPTPARAPSPAAPGAAALRAAGLSASPEIQDIQAIIMSDPEAMAALVELAQDPKLAALLMQPGLFEAVQRGDMAALAKDPTVAKLANDPRIKALISRIAGQVQAR